MERNKHVTARIKRKHLFLGKHLFADDDPPVSPGKGVQPVDLLLESGERAGVIDFYDKDRIVAFSSKCPVKCGKDRPRVLPVYIAEHFKARDEEHRIPGKAERLAVRFASLGNKRGLRIMPDGDALHLCRHHVFDVMGRRQYQVHIFKDRYP